MRSNPSFKNHVIVLDEDSSEEVEGKQVSTSRGKRLHKREEIAIEKDVKTKEGEKTKQITLRNLDILIKATKISE